jgi:hypothetical protein
MALEGLEPGDARLYEEDMGGLSFLASRAKVPDVIGKRGAVDDEGCAGKGVVNCIGLQVRKEMWDAHDDGSRGVGYSHNGSR